MPKLSVEVQLESARTERLGRRITPYLSHEDGRVSNTVDITSSDKRHEFGSGLPPTTGLSLDPETGVHLDHGANNCHDPDSPSRLLRGRASSVAGLLIRNCP